MPVILNWFLKPVRLTQFQMPVLMEMGLYLLMKTRRILSRFVKAPTMDYIQSHVKDYMLFHVTDYMLSHVTHYMLSHISD